METTRTHLILRPVELVVEISHLLSDVASILLGEKKNSGRRRVWQG